MSSIRNYFYARTLHDIHYPFLSDILDALNKLDVPLKEFFAALAAFIYSGLKVIFQLTRG